MSFITAIGTAVPPHRFSQNVIAEFMLRAMQPGPHESRKLRTIFKSSGIQYRHSVLDDYGKTRDFSFYPEDFEPFPSTERRIELYQRHALPLSVEAIHQALRSQPDVDLNSITHLIVVSCTGMYAPGLDIDLVRVLPLRDYVHRTCIQFMGCYAAFNALKAAHAFCQADTTARVLVVCTELCSLHFQREPTEDNMLANALFADGAAALVVQANPSRGFNFLIRGFHNRLVFNGAEHMAWYIGDAGFQMRLSGYVPDLIRQGIGSLTEELLGPYRLNVGAIPYFAIHPGGKKILQAMEAQLHLKPEHLRPAYRTLENFGNMSSPTVLFVLQELMQQLTPADTGSDVLSFAFGPGLTMESMLLSIYYA
jgi:predicted naringenin-chalcone synthase